MSVEHHCQVIIRELKTGKYTKHEMKFLLKLFTEIKRVTEEMLEKHDA